MNIKKRSGLMRNALLLFVFAILIPSAALSSWLCGLMVRRHYEQSVEDGRAMLRVVRDSILTNASLVENLLDLLAYDSGVLQLLSDTNMSDYERIVSQMYDVRETLGLAQSYLKELDGNIILFAQDERVPESFWYVLHMDELEDSEDFQRFDQMGDVSAWVGLAELRPSSTVIQAEDNREMFCFYRDIYRGIRNRVGVIKCGVSPSKLFSAVSMNAGENPLYVVENGNVILQTQPGTLPEYEAGLSVQRVGERLLLICPVASVGVDLVMELDYGAILFQGMLNGLPQLLIVLLSSAFLLHIVRRYLHAIQIRLDEAVVIGERAKAGHLDIAFPKPGNDEISMLVEAFNALLERLQVQAKEKIAYERAKRRIMQLALQYQMNPHFLFNTLNWLQMSIEMGVEKEKLSDAIVLLGKLLRYNLNSDAYSTLREEIESTRNYIRLMNMCKRNPICLELNLEGIDDEERMIRFLFQPLCENAIQHGMAPQKQLTIRLNGWREGKNLYFAIENDGKPIPPEQIPCLLDYDRTIQTGRGVGLANIAARIDLLYAKGSGIEISSENGWTRVLLRLCGDGGESDAAESADRG